MQHAVRIAQFLALGYSQFGRHGFESHARHFDPAALSTIDLTNRHILITGATSGIGRATAHALARKNATLHLICRDQSRGHAVRDAILQDVGEQTTAVVHVHQCDLSSLRDIERLAGVFVDDGATTGDCNTGSFKNCEIHALVNNAGVMLHNVTLSTEGYEKSFATNTLGTYALTEMLMPALRPRHDGQESRGARVITVSSGGMLTERLEVDDLEGDNLRKGDDKQQLDGSRQYARCKRRQVAMTEYWTEKYGSSGVFFASMHPGWANTPGLETSMPEFHKATRKQLRTQEQGADTIVYLTAVDDVQTLKAGGFYFDRQAASKHLLLAGTQYKASDVERMMKRLKTMVEAKGFSLPA